MFNKLSQRLSTDPLYILFRIIAFLRGLLYVIYFRLFRKNVRIKIPFYVSSKISIRGPGTVSIGSNCRTTPHEFSDLSIVTLSPEAEIVIGNKCNLSGGTIRCYDRVEMGSNVMLANTLIQDVLFLHSEKPEHKPILIGDNVWLSSKTITLGGCNLGNNSVLSIGSVCGNQNIPESRLAIGNPVVSSLSLNYF